MDRRSRSGDLKDLTRDLAKQTNCPTVMVTRGANGSLLCRDGKDFTTCPAFAFKIVDRMGAGDAVLAITSLLAATQAPPEVISFVGNLAGAEAVAIVGNERSIGRVQLLKSITSILK